MKKPSTEEVERKESKGLQKNYQLKKKFSEAIVFGRKIQNGNRNLKTNTKKRGKSPMDSIV